MSTDLDKTIVLGLGDAVQSDQGWALRATAQVRNDPRLPQGTVVLHRESAGLDLLPELWDCSRLLILTAVHTGGFPGALVRSSGEQLRMFATSGSIAQLGIADIYVALHLLAMRPPQISLLGVQAQCTGGTCLPPADLDKAIPTLVNRVIAELTANTCRATADVRFSRDF